jgi:hypothetical protein
MRRWVTLPSGSIAIFARIIEFGSEVPSRGVAARMSCADLETGKAVSHNALQLERFCLANIPLRAQLSGLAFVDVRAEMQPGNLADWLAPEQKFPKTPI